MSLEHTESTIQHNMDLNTLKPEHIDYIIFLDSDDYWKLNCIETCIKHAEGVDIVWFDAEVFCINDKNAFELMENGESLYDFSIHAKITRDEWLSYYAINNFSHFYFAHSGLIDFSFLTIIGLYFLNGVIHEDHNFGTLLFLQSRNIFVLNEKPYYYRVRPNSITRFDAKNPHIVPHCQFLYNAFQDSKVTKHYHIASSWFLMLLELIEFLRQNPSLDNAIIEKCFFPMYIEHSLKLLDYKHDPLNLIHKMPLIEPYLKKGFKYRHKLRITNPKKYKQMLPLFRIYDGIKALEKELRKILKARKKKERARKA